MLIFSLLEPQALTWQASSGVAGSIEHFNCNLTAISLPEKKMQEPPTTRTCLNLIHLLSALLSRFTCPKLVCVMIDRWGDGQGSNPDY